MIDDDAGDGPTGGIADELLADPPELGIGGALAGDAAGARTRLWILGGIVAGLAIVVAGIMVFERQHAPGPGVPVPAYVTDGAPVRDEDRVLRWSSEGEARLGLTREPPGVLAIELPDRVVRLADGIDHAQVEVVIRSGETVAVRPLVGRVLVE